MKMGLRQAIISAAVFGLLFLALVSVDDRVHERFRDLFDRGRRDLDLGTSSG